MNQYAFNVFLEKQRNKKQIEEGILGTAATAIGTAMKDSHTFKNIKGVGAVIAGAKKSAPSAKLAFTKGYRRAIEQGDDLGGAVKRGLGGALETGVRGAVKDKKTADRIVGMGKKLGSWVAAGGFSSKFNRQAADRGVGTDGYSSGFGQFAGGASTQDARRGNTRDRSGLDPVQRIQALLQGRR